MSLSIFKIDTAICLLLLVLLTRSVVYGDNPDVGYSGDGSPDYGIPTDVASGTRFRKIALNGRPMVDEKPQDTLETSEEKEETFIDAMTLGLHHSATEIYIPVPGSTLVLSARRNAESEVWNTASGLRPGENANQPFGPCWSSSIAPHVEFICVYGLLINQLTIANVTDENGSVHRFVLYGGNFFPLPSSRTDNSDYLCTLATDNGYKLPNDWDIQGWLKGSNSCGLVFTGKFGTTISFGLTKKSTPFVTTITQHRGYYESGHEDHVLLQAISIKDRLGKEIRFGYGNDLSVLPTSISVINGTTSQTIAIESQTAFSIQNTGSSTIPIVVDPSPPLPSTANDVVIPSYLVTKITDPNGNVWKFDYSQYIDFHGAKSPLLSSVTINGPDSILKGKTTYGYNAVDESSIQNQPPGADAQYHCDISSIGDGNGNTYQINYAFDISRHEGNFQKIGLPRNVANVVLPISGTATFSNLSNIKLSGNDLTGYGLDIGGCCKTSVTDAVGNITTYDFTNMQVLDALQPNPEQYTQGADRPRILFFTTMKITDGGFCQTFTFDEHAGMALSTSVDIYGNTTTYQHQETAPVISSVADSFRQAWGNLYDDPNVELKKDKNGVVTGTNSFTYGQFRIMNCSTDELGRKTISELDTDPLFPGRRLAEDVQGPTSRPGDYDKRTEFKYENSNFPGVVTRKTVKALHPENGEVDLVVSYTLDNNGNVGEEIVDPDGLHPMVTQNTYDANNNKISSTDGNGNLTTFDYDCCNHLTKVTYADGSYKSYDYDVSGNKVQETDENGNITNYVYDALNRLVETHKVMDANDSSKDLVTKSEYSDINTKTSVTDPNGYKRQMFYDSIQRLTDIITAVGTDVSGTTHFEYGDNSGANAFDTSTFKPTLIRDPRGIETTMTYDDHYRRLTRSVKYAQGSGGAWLVASSSNGYDAVGNVISQVDPVGNVTVTDYDSLNHPVDVFYYGQTGTPLCVTRTDYTTTGLKWRTTDELGRVTETQYDGAGRPVTVIAPAVDNGYGTITNPITQTVYDAAGNVASVINPLNFQTDYGYNARNRKIWEKSPSIGIWASHTVQVLDSSEVDTFFGQTFVRPLTQWEYDFVGNQTKMTDPKGAITDTTYDPVNRPVTVLGPEVESGRPTTHTFYDANGNVTYLQDPNGHWAHNEYDALNRLKSTTSGAASQDGPGLKVSYEYDLVGNRTKVTDGNNNSTLFEYDGLNRNTTITDALGYATIFGYDAADKTSRTDGNGSVTHYTYDYRHRLQTANYDWYSNDNRTYTYDLGGNLLNVSEPGQGGVADVTYGYDELNRTVAENSGGTFDPGTGICNGGFTHTYKYDLAGNRLSALYSGDTVPITYSYDALNRLETVVEGGRTTINGYDLAGNFSFKRLANYDVESMVYDLAKRLTWEGCDSAVGVRQYGYTYSHDLAGNLTGITESDLPPYNQVQTFTYDTSNRLTDETSTAFGSKHYEYDNANNRTGFFDPVTGGQVNCYYNALNQLLSYVGFTKSGINVYDAAGNRIRSGVRTSNGVTSRNYLYDGDNRLVYIHGGDYFTYDYRSRRVERVAGGYMNNNDGDRHRFLTIIPPPLETMSMVWLGDSEPEYHYQNADPSVYATSPQIVCPWWLGGVTCAGGTSTRVVFSGGVSVQEYTGDLATQTVEYIRGHEMGGGVGGILYSIRGTPDAPQYSFDHYNIRGDVVATTGTDGTKTWQGWYDAFGTHTHESGNAPQDRQRANTKEEDPTGLLNEGFRYRDLETGVFLTKDPIGNTLMMPKEKWFVDGKEVTAQEYEQALEPGVPQAGNGPTKTAKDSGQEADAHVAGSEEGAIPGQKSHLHTAAAGFPNLYTYVNENPWTFFDPEGLITVGFEGYGTVTLSGGTKDTEGNVTLREHVAAQGGKDYSRSQAGQAEALKAVQTAQAKGDNTVNVYGYSRGGIAANDFASKLQKAGVNVDHLTLIDPVSLAGGIPHPAHLTVPSNVKQADDYYQHSGGPFQGGAAANPGKTVRNHDLSGKGVNHNTIVEKVVTPKPATKKSDD